MKEFINKFVPLGAILLFAAVGLLSGCAQKSYPADQIKESLIEICREEYGIEDIDVKIVGETIGVYLPLEKLFAADLKEAFTTGKVRNLETLFEPSPEALEKVEDVLFSISRVILSTDRPLTFYMLEATDVVKTGMQLILKGYINDIKRVRVWDISRGEYRKRLIHELRLNRAVIFHKPVRQFFKDIEALALDKIHEKYFNETLPQDAIQTLFMNALRRDSSDESLGPWKIIEMRSAPIQKDEVLVYTRVQPPLDAQTVGETEPVTLQFLFMLTVQDEQPHIVRIIPFQYLNESGEMQQIPFPKELQIQENLDKWEEEFPVEEMKVGPFLADQITRRVQSLLLDPAHAERIQNTFHEVKLNFEYHEEPVSPHYSLDIEAVLKESDDSSQGPMAFHEDMIYLLNVASREFVDVLRSYRFGNFTYLSLNISEEPSQWILGREDLEMFRRKKIDLQGLLTLPKI